MPVDERKDTYARAMGEQPISLVIPCRAEYIGLCRVLASVMGARESLHAEDIADLKLVVTEACACFLGGPDGSRPAGPGDQSGCPPRNLRVDFDVLPQEWKVTVSDSEHRYHIPRDSKCDPYGPGGIGLTIMNALVDKVEHTDSDTEGSVIRLVKRLPLSPPGHR